MKIHRKSWLASFLLAGFSLLQSCGTPSTQSDASMCDQMLLRAASGSSCTEPGPFVAPVATRSFVARYEFSNSSNLPDSVTASTMLDSAGSCSLRNDGMNSHGRIQLTFRCSFAKAVQPVDTVFLRMFLGSMRFAIVPYLHTSDSTWSAIMATHRVDVVALRILERLAGTARPKTDSGVREAYASLLVGGEISVGGFPQTSPVGVDADKVRTVALRHAVELGKPLSQTIAQWNLDLDLASAKAKILLLEPRISASDSAALFP